jgi:hypothetical protein
MIILQLPSMHVHPNVYIQVTPLVSLPVRALIFKKSLIECYRNYIEAGFHYICFASAGEANEMLNRAYEMQSPFILILHQSVMYRTM